MIVRTLLVVLSIKTINASCTFYDHRKLREEVKKYYHGESTCEDDAPFWNVSALTSLEGVFESLDYFYLDLSEWDVSNVGNFGNTFKERSITFLVNGKAMKICLIDSFNRTNINKKILDKIDN